MSVLDQAFIRAYMQQDAGCDAAPEHAPQNVVDDELYRVDQPFQPMLPFRPMLQVDHFVWPKVCCRLEEAADDELEALADGLVAAMTRGHKVLAISGCHSGEGATTLVLCAGRRLAERGFKVVMVDANLADPKLGNRLGLLPEFGWEETLAGRLPLQEVVIESTRCQLAVLPLCESFAFPSGGDWNNPPPNGRGGPTGDETRMAESITALAEHYDLILVDLGPLENLDVVGGSLARGISGRLDAVLLVHSDRTASEENLDEIQRHLATAHIAHAGIVKNFVRA